MENEMRATITTKSGDVLEPTIERYHSQREIFFMHVERIRRRDRERKVRVDATESVNTSWWPLLLLIAVLAGTAWSV